MDDAANNNIDPLALSNGADLVNRELASAGYHKRLVFDLQKGTVEAQSVIQCVFALLQHFKRESAFREELGQRVVSLERDHEQAETAMASIDQKETARFKGKLELKDRDNDSLRSKIDLLEKGIKEHSDKNQALKDEIKVLKSNATTEKAKLQNELRKKERESDKLKEKIQKVVVEKQSSQKLGMRLLNNTAGQPQMSLHPNFSAKKKMQNISAEQDIYNTIMFKLEEREKTLILENQNLKQTLEAVCSRLHGSMSDELDSPNAENGTSTTLEMGRFHLPYELAKDQVEQFIFQRIEAIEQNVHRQQQVRLEQQQAQQDNYCKGNTEEMIGDLSNQVIILRRQLDEQLDIIKEQSRLLEMSMDTDYFVADDHDEEEGIEYVRRMEAEHQFERTTLEIKAQWDSVNSRSQSLSEERLKFTEAAVKLGVERLNFEREKSFFEQHILLHQAKESVANIKSPSSIVKTPSTVRSNKTVTFTPSVDIAFREDFSQESSIANDENNMNEPVDGSFNELATISTPRNLKQSPLGDYFFNTPTNNHSNNKSLVKPIDSWRKTLENMDRLKRTPVSTKLPPSAPSSVMGTTPRTSSSSSKRERKELFSGVMSPAKLSVLEQKIRDMQRTPAKSMLSHR